MLVARLRDAIESERRKLNLVGDSAVRDCTYRAAHLVFLCVWLWLWLWLWLCVYAWVGVRDVAGG